ncbi:acyltransferase family protein [Pseudomonas sp. RA_15y_Pfl2_54]|uniref:acyltransferase family protein n=1 Tax=Pseudomonas sp. RA_15y_Pfl2_54 TaxID=3088704 RepID=UPI0030DC8013
MNMWHSIRNAPTIGSMSRNGGNNFDLIRMVSALAVLWAHSFALSGKPSDLWFMFFMGYDPGRVAVMVFFVLSGFLVSGSLERNSIFDFFRARILRIVPALIGVSLFTVFVVGPIFTKIPRLDYFSSSSVYEYLLNSIPYQTSFYLPGLFKDLPISGGVNGSLWTIPIEFFCYCALALIVFPVRKSFVLAASLIVPIAAFQIWNGLTGAFVDRAFFGTTSILPVLKYGLFFLIGSTFWAYRERIKHSGWLAVISVFFLACGSMTGYLNFFLYLGLPYLVFYFAYSRPVLDSLLRRVGDVSYGTYLFAFPVQQSLVQITNKQINGWQLAISASIFTLFLAWLSWRYIEKPALRFKRSRKSFLPESNIKAVNS